MRIIVAEFDGLTPTAQRELRKAGRVRFLPPGTTTECLPMMLAMTKPDVLWVRLRHRINAEVMDASPNLKYIVSPTTGTDHIDLEAAAARGIEVVTLRSETAFLETIPATAELTLALILALTRRIVPAVDHTRTGGWDRYQFQGTDLRGKTVAVVGPGRVGMQVARLLRAFGCSVRLVREGDSLTDGIANADIVTCHVDLRPETYYLFNADAFGAMKPGALFVNTSRGQTVITSVLLQSLKSGQLGGAALDVLNDDHGIPDGVREFAAEHPDQLILTPHIGGFTRESLAAAELFAARKLIRLLTNQPAVV